MAGEENYIAISAQLHKRWERELNEYGIIYLYAMTGYGKTSQTEIFAKEIFKEYIRISVENEDFLEKARDYINENLKPKVRTLLIIDDLQWLRNETEQRCLFNLLLSALKEKPRIRIMLLSRAPLPAYLIPLQVTRQLLAS